MIVRAEALLLYYDDLPVGMTIRTGEVQITAGEIVEFAAKFDPQPFHLDEHAARDSLFGGLVASGWLTAARSMRLVIEGKTKLAGGWVGLGIDSIQWPCAVRPDDRISVASEVVAKRVSKSKQGYGIVTFSTTTYNQHGVIVQRMVNNHWIPLKTRTA